MKGNLYALCGIVALCCTKLNFSQKKKYMPQYLHGPVYVCALHGSAELWTPIMSVSTLPALVTVRIIQTSSELHQPKEPYSNNGLLQKNIFMLMMMSSVFKKLFCLNMYSQISMKSCKILCKIFTMCSASITHPLLIFSCLPL